MSSRWYEDQVTVAQKYVVWLDKTYPNSPLTPRLDILRRPPHLLKWPDSLVKFHQACEFQMMGCSQKIAAPWELAAMDVDPGVVESSDAKEQQGIACVERDWKMWVQEEEDME
ncbi:unnamed protein product [Sphagnum tenellum]